MWTEATTSADVRCVLFIILFPRQVVPQFFHFHVLSFISYCSVLFFGLHTFFVSTTIVYIRSKYLSKRSTINNSRGPLSSCLLSPNLSVLCIIFIKLSYCIISCVSWTLNPRPTLWKLLRSVCRRRREGRSGCTWRHASSSTGTTPLIRVEATAALKNLDVRLATKWRQPYSKTYGYVKSRIVITLVRANRRFIQ